MRRTLMASALLGAILALVIIAHDTLRLTAAWPVVLGFALWDRVGDRGSRVFGASLAAMLGALLGFLAVALPTAFMPFTSLSLGIAAGVTAAVIVAIGFLAKDRMPLPAMLIGFASFLGVFSPLWAANPGSIQSHGVENLTVVWFGLLIGALSVALVRSLTDAAPAVVPAIHAEEERVVEIAPLPRTAEGGAS